MAEATARRLDIVDAAIEYEWRIESTGASDEFSRGGVTVVAHYADGDQIRRIIRFRPNHEDEVCDAAAAGDGEMLRFWLTGLTRSDRATLGAKLAERRAAGNALLADPALRAGGRLVAVTLSGSGRLSKRTVDGSRFWATADESGIWGLCYAVEGARRGSNQDRGCLWGMQNNYARAAQEVANMSARLRNGTSKLKPGSVFCCPAYVVFNDAREIDSMGGLLEQAYRAWVKGVDPVV